MSESKGKSSDYVASTAMLFKVLYHKSKNVFLIFCVCCAYLCEKYYRPITVQCYIADYVSWVSRPLTLLDLEQIGLTSMLSKWNLFLWRGPPVFAFQNLLP